MDKHNATNAANDQATQDQAQLLDLDDSQLGLVGGGDSTPNWQDPPNP